MHSKYRMPQLVPGIRQETSHRRARPSPGRWRVRALGTQRRGEDDAADNACHNRPTAGGVALDPGVPRDERPRRSPCTATIGFLPQGFAFAPRFTVSDFLTYVAWIKEVPRTKTRAAVDRVLDRVDLGDQATTRLGALSGGMLQRVGIASALVNDPAVVLLDEPTVGLDPEQRLSFRRLIGDLTDTTVLLSTHLVEDVAAMSLHVLVMAHGSITFSGAVDALHALGSAEPDEFTSPLERGYLAAIAMPATGQRSP